MGELNIIPKMINIRQPISYEKSLVERKQPCLPHALQALNVENEGKKLIARRNGEKKIIEIACFSFFARHFEIHSFSYVGDVGFLIVEEPCNI